MGRSPSVGTAACKHRLMPKSTSRPPVVVTLAERLISNGSLPVQTAYVARGVRPGVCSRRLRAELATATYAARLIMTARDCEPWTPADYLHGVLESIAGDDTYVAFTRRSSSPSSAEAIVVRRGLLGSDQSGSALVPEQPRKDSCPSGKVLYSSSAAAAGGAARHVANAGGVPMSSYHCSKCGWWHLTSQPSPVES